MNIAVKIKGMTVLTSENIPFKSSHPNVFLKKGVLKIRIKFTGEHRCRSVISIKLRNNFVEVTLRHRCSPVNLMHVFRTPFSTNFIETTLWRGCSPVNLMHIFRTPF